MHAMKDMYLIYWDQILNIIVIDYRLNKGLDSAV